MNVIERSRIGTFACSLLALVAWVVPPPAAADVDMTPDSVLRRPPRLFSDNMVLQRDVPMPIFGRADPGEMVTVSIDGQQKIVVAEPDGTWSVDLDPMPGGGPHQMTIQGNNLITINGVLVGEVWVAAGQSNMTRKKVKRSILEANPLIRTIKKRDWEDKPGLNPFTFAMKLHEELGVPIGIMNLASGGSIGTAWLAPTAVSDPDPELAQYLKGNWGLHYRRFMETMQPYRIRGVVWWQGEADRKRPERYRTVYPAIIRGIRTGWGLGDIPWIAMQVPTGRGLLPGEIPDPVLPSPSAEDSSAFNRHTFLRALEEFPFSSMVSTLDLEGGLHPKDTDSYAGRLADHALALVYGQSIVYSGPLYSSMAVEGSSIRITYRADTADGLVAQGGGPLQGFAITEDNVTWHWADALIQGSEVLLSSASVTTPVAARYAWANRPVFANLSNGAGLSAAAFATDTTPGEYGP